MEVEAYVNASGSCPLDDWLNALRDRATLARILTRLDRMRNFGNLGDHRSVGGGVSEMRIHHGPGYRVYFSKIGVRIVLLLCGGTKRDQKGDILRAREYLEDYLRGKADESK